MRIFASAVLGGIPVAALSVFLENSLTSPVLSDILIQDKLYKSIRWMDVSTNCPQLTIIARWRVYYS